VPSAVATTLAIKAISSDSQKALVRPGTPFQSRQLSSVKPCQV
jgi:hypothetical protein